MDEHDYFRDLYELVVDRSLDTDETIGRVLAVGCERLGAADGFVTYTADGDYEVLASTVDGGAFAPGSVSDLSATWCRHVVADRSPLAVADATETAAADDPAVTESDLRCYIGAPLVVDGETYGTLCFASESPRAEPFSESERRFVSLLAAYVGGEIERDRHHRELRAENERLDEFAGVVAHDLRNPLSVARGYTDSLLARADGEEAEHLRTVDESLTRMAEMIDDLLTLAREGTDVGEREVVALRAVTRDAWDGVATDGDEDEDGDEDHRSPTLVVDTEAVIYADRSRLRQLFENLFRNSLEHGPGDVTVTVADAPDGDGFTVADDAGGLPADVAADPFGEAEGFGLVIVERIVAGHDWTVSVDSDDTGTTFTVGNVVHAPESAGGVAGTEGRAPFEDSSATDESARTD
ncbi:GAF domain-containing sensor histidine kinase [Halobaculum sp. MBLA0147]|uniref:sensor histidine kinase n=1 Tax=Halobaculum sp. MBLA0147 TaxID=3079934 RepID=UPI003524AC87